MTKTVSTHRERFPVTQFKDRSKFDEKFPDIPPSGPIARPPSFSTVMVPDSTSKCSDKSPTVGMKTSYVGDEERRRQRHTWTCGLRESFEMGDEYEVFNDGTRRGSSDSSPCWSGGSWSGERRRSSSSSVTEAIEECPSEEEEEEDEVETSRVDYMKCRNCSNDNNINNNSNDNSNDNNINNSGHNYSDNMNYCFNCKHLYQKTTLGGVLGEFDHGRRSSWTAGERRVFEFQRQSSHSSNSSSMRSSRCSSTRASISGSIDLPAITEPEDDETNAVLEQQVQNEVEKLMRFNHCTSNMLQRRETIGCEKELKKKLLTQLNQTSRSLDSHEGKPLHCRGQNTMDFLHAASIEVFHPF